MFKLQIKKWICPACGGVIVGAEREDMLTIICPNCGRSLSMSPVLILVSTLVAFGCGFETAWLLGETEFMFVGVGLFLSFVFLPVLSFGICFFKRPKLYVVDDDDDNSLSLFGR